VYLGKRVPKYLISNVRRCSTDFPKNKVVLATDSKRSIDLHGAEQVLVPQDLLRRNGGYGFRSGFWYKTFDRLFAIEVVHEMYPMSPILHIEGDVRLSPNLNFECFSATKLNWGSVTADEDGAALIQSPSLETSRLLTAALRAEQDVDASVTDMRALANIRRSHRDYVELLPTTADGVEGAIFDFAPIGMWLGGTDPRNTRGVSFFRQRHEVHLVDPRNLEFKARDGTLFTRPKGHSRAFEVQNLHLHSKSLRLFSTPWPDLVEKLVGERRSSSFNFVASLRWTGDRIGEYIRLVRNVAIKLVRPHH
jgi:hypothetical protein